ncbi:NADH oxidase [Sporothrix schenckii 1099-18]|uniref:NADH oxidase n=1 Tax=Sporothrix schenckii 1099-18 TaxID=1397361 RepID=A0A0F2LX36_SPOSC|nr:NADH oxidase [Sporothrix schenckii 1099-18]KJR82017.1 NADH oxidase [Sporothrix schenckii 1099-18]
MAAANTPTQLPPTMRAWVYQTGKGGIENTLKLIPDYPVPSHFRTLEAPPPGQGDAVLVRILAASLNPVDYKLVELPVVGGLLQKTPATPAVDFCGRVVRVGTSATTLKEGQLVAGKLPPQPQHGALADYAVAHSVNVVPVPDGVSVEQAATIGLAGATAWTALVPQMEAAQARNTTATGRGRDKPLRVFVNGGSGGIGSFAIPLAKARGCHVTATCSAASAQLVRDVLGADDVIDYRTTDVADALVQKTNEAGRPYDVAVDVIGMRFGLYKAADAFLAAGAAFPRIGMEPGTIKDAVAIVYRPTLLGGGRHASPFVAGRATPDILRGLLDLMAQGQLTVPLDGGAAVPFEDVPRAYARLKTQRTQGKIVVRVAEDN